MEDLLIIAILVVILVIALRSARKHRKGQGGCCCGGGEVTIRPKKLKHVIAQRTVSIEGMTCEHCKSRVESRLNELAGVSARVNLKAKTAIVSMEKEISDEKIRETIEKAGYTVVTITDVKK